MAAADYNNLVQSIYISYFGRPADTLGLINFENALNNAGAPTDIQGLNTAYSRSPAIKTLIDSFGTSAESAALYTGDNISFVTAIYNNVLNRAPDFDGLVYWATQIGNGSLSKGDAALSIMAGALVNTSAQGLIDAAVLNAKVAVATNFTTAIDTGAELSAYSGNAAAATARDMLKTVTATTVATAFQPTVDATLAALVTASIPTQTFALTTGIDNLIGTSGNDIFNADQTQLSGSDIINGGAGKDTFNYIDSGTTGGAFPSAQFSGVEVINIRNVNGTAATAAVAEVAQVTFVDVTGGGTVNIGGRIITATGGTATAADIATAFRTGTTTNFAVVSGALTGYTAAVGDNGTAIKFTSTVAGNVTDLTSAVTGSGAVAGITITQGVAGVASNGVTDVINVGNFTGATNFVSNLSTNDVTFTGIGAGQTVGVTGNGAVTNGNTNFSLSGTTAETISVVGGVTAGAISNTSAGALTATINSTGADNTVGIVTLASGSTITTATINATTGFKATSLGGFGTNAAIVVTGAGAVNIGTLASSVGSVDASAATGGLTATLNAGVTSLKGSTGADTITTGATTATGAVIDGGAGTDILIVAATNDITSAAKGAQYTGFETLRNTQVSAFDASLVAGVTTVQTGAAGAGFINLSAAQAASIGVRVSQSAVTYSLKDSSGVADTLGLSTTSGTTVLNVNGITATGFENINLVSSAGAAGNNVNLKADGVTAAAAGTDYSTFSFTSAADLAVLKVSGAKAAGVTINGLAKVTTLDASANTAGVDLTTGAQTVALTVTATAAADKITLGAMGAGGSQSILAGAGDDKISGFQADVTLAAKIDGGAGVDTLTLNDTSITVNDQTFKNVVGVEKIAFAATTDMVFSVGGYANAIATSNAGVLDVSAKALASTGPVTIDASGLGGTNLLKLALTDTAGTGALSITSSIGGHDVITVATATSHTGSITVSGASNTAGLTIDASGVLFGGGLNNFSGGSGADTIKVGAITANIFGGAGADQITVGANDHAGQIFFYNTAGASTTTAFDVITGFATNDTTNDTLRFTSNTVNTGSALSTGWTVTNGIATKVGASVADFITALSTTTTVGAVAFSDGSNTWVAYADGVAAVTSSDMIVELVGVQGVTALGTGSAALKITIA